MDGSTDCTDINTIVSSRRCCARKPAPLWKWSLSRMAEFVAWSARSSSDEMKSAPCAARPSSPLTRHMSANASSHATRSLSVSSRSSRRTYRTARRPEPVATVTPSSLVLATRSGQVKKSRLSDYDTNRQGGIIAINLAEDDEVIGARLVSTEDDIFLASTKGMSVRFTASDENLRPMGRDTRGVIGMRFREGDSLLSMDIVQPGQHIVTITDGGFAKRTLEDEWTARNRGILGVRAIKIDEKRGSLVAAMICDPDDQIFAIASNGVVIRTAVSELRPSGRDTMGVTMMRLGDEDSVVAVARSGEKANEDDISEDVQDETEHGEPDTVVESEEGDSA